MAGAIDTSTTDDSRRLLQRLLEGPIPRGPELDACRAVLRADPGGEAAFPAACMLLEGALADPQLDIDETQRVVRLLKDLAAGRVTTEELL